MSLELSSPPSLDQVLEAVSRFYRNEACTDKEAKEMAGKWLESIQKSVYAWEIADQLLIRRSDVETCYFAAQTLRMKLQNSFSELPPDSYTSLRNSIINHCKEINVKVIQTQLSLCITYLAILDVSWTNPVEEIVASGLDYYVVVEILTLLPEELNQSRNPNLKSVGGNRRTVMLKYLTSIGPKMVTFLYNTMREIKCQLTKDTAEEPESKQQIAEKLFAKIYRCLGAWLTIIDASDINCIEPLLTAIFSSLQDPNTPDTIHDAAADTICSAALLCEEYDKYHHLTHYLLIQIYQLEGVYQHSVNNEDIDKSVNFSRIFTEMAESVVNPLIIGDGQIPVNSPVSGLDLVSLLLRCVDHYDFEVAEITFQFWYRFAELICKRNNHVAQTYSQHVIKLLDGLTIHCQLDTDQEHLLTPQSDLQEFRIRVKDLVKKVIVIVGASTYIRHNNIVTSLKTSFGQMSKDQISWEQDEAYLFMILCLIKDIYDDSALVTDVVNLILFTRQCQFNPNTGVQVRTLHPQIFATCCNILGELSDWFENQPTILFNHVLDYLLPLVTTNNSQDKSMVEMSKSPSTSESSVSLSSIAASALNQIISCCAARHLIGNDTIIELLMRICIQSDVLNEAAVHNLLQCCSTVVSQSTENKSRIDQEIVVVKLLEPSVGCLSRIVSGTLEAGKADPVIYMDRISSIFRCLRLKPRIPNLTPNESPLDIRVMELWKLIDAVLKHTSSTSDSRTVEKACRCLRYVIRCLKPIHLLIPVAECIVNLYSQFPQHSCYLYLASILVDEFGDTGDLSLTDADREKIDNGLLEMLTHFWRPTFALLSGQRVELRNHPETIDDFFRLCTRYLQKNGLRFLSFSMLGQILELSLASLALDHREANTSVCKFIGELIETGKDPKALPIIRDQVEQLLTACLGNDDCYGQKLTNTLMNCSLTTLPSFYIPDMADILWRLLNWDKTRACLWLEKTLQAVSIHLQPTTPDAAPLQLQEFYETIKNASNMKLLISSMRSLSRTYR
ncbi:transportin-3 [Tetranychus urticae]|uniref:Exportin-1/Importin-beta-like domain-containing protein n=1 Tax=Tetranychus urticae TaxID=32264 RepID=T1L3W4_TETUR|nr:transportin-3 [Tetranychus urticae]